nr:glycine-rich protein 5-like [Rhipicephalus microplus]
MAHGSRSRELGGIAQGNKMNIPNKFPSKPIRPRVGPVGYIVAMEGQAQVQGGGGGGGGGGFGGGFGGGAGGGFGGGGGGGGHEVYEVKAVSSGGGGGGGFGG